MNLHFNKNTRGVRTVTRRFGGAVLYALYLLVVLEVSARALLAIEPAFRRIVGPHDDSSSRLRWVRRHGRQLTTAQYRFDIYDPVRGWALMPSVKDMAVFDGKTLNSTSKGIRGATEYKYDKEPGKYRIIALGDSYTFGEEVSDDETYSHYLAALLPDSEVLNLGVHGYGHDQMLMYLKEEGLKYRPDVVIVGFVWVDMVRNLAAFTSFSKPAFELKSGRLHLLNVPVPNPASVIHREVYRSKAFDLGVILLGRIREAMGVNQGRAEEITRAIFDELISTAHRNGAVTVFVYLPVLAEIVNRDTAMTENEQFLLAYCRERKVPCLFLRQRFLDEQVKGATYNTRSHWQANAHETAAARIVEYLKANSLTHSGVAADFGAEIPVALR